MYVGKTILYVFQLFKYNYNLMVIADEICSDTYSFD